jgi:hypothetical protein
MGNNIDNIVNILFQAVVKFVAIKELVNLLSKAMMDSLFDVVPISLSNLFSQCCAEP